MVLYLQEAEDQPLGLGGHRPQVLVGAGEVDSGIGGHLVQHVLGIPVLPVPGLDGRDLASQVVEQDEGDVEHIIILIQVSRVILSEFSSNYSCSSISRIDLNKAQHGFFTRVKEKAPEGAGSRVNGSRVAGLHRPYQPIMKTPESFTVHPAAAVTAEQLPAQPLEDGIAFHEPCILDCQSEVEIAFQRHRLHLGE